MQLIGEQVRFLTSNEIHNFKCLSQRQSIDEHNQGEVGSVTYISTHNTSLTAG